MDLPFGGKVPFDYALTVEAGGNAANVAVGLARLGLATAIAAHVGSDQIGRDMQAALHHEGVDTHLMRFDPGQPSNRNFVLWFGSDRTILVRHELYDYHWPHLSPTRGPPMGVPEFRRLPCAGVLRPYRLLARCRALGIPGVPARVVPDRAGARTIQGFVPDGPTC